MEDGLLLNAVIGKLTLASVLFDKYTARLCPGLYRQR
jgi:hypothetical protein